MSLSSYIDQVRAPAAILVANLILSASMAATWTVCPDGTGEFTTIQAAIAVSHAVPSRDGLVLGPAGNSCASPVVRRERR